MIDFLHFGIILSKTVDPSKMLLRHVNATYSYNQTFSY